MGRAARFTRGVIPWLRLAAAAAIAVGSLTATEAATACQANTSAFDWIGEVRLDDARRPQLFALDRDFEWQPHSIASPPLGGSVANDLYSHIPVSRIELVRATSWRRDGLLQLSSKSASIGWGWLDLGQWSADVAIYAFSVDRTLLGQPRSSLRLSRIDFPTGDAWRRWTFWFVAAPSLQEERLALRRDLDWCEQAAARRREHCDRAQVARNYEGAVLYRPQQNCNVYYGFRIGEPAILFWRGGVLAGVADVTPEAYRHLLRGEWR